MDRAAGGVLTNRRSASSSILTAYHAHLGIDPVGQLPIYQPGPLTTVASCLHTSIFTWQLLCYLENPASATTTPLDLSSFLLDTRQRYPDAPYREAKAIGPALGTRPWLLMSLRIMTTRPRSHTLLSMQKISPAADTAVLTHTLLHLGTTRLLGVTPACQNALAFSRSPSPRL